MTFKPDPKKQVSLKFLELFGTDHGPVEVRGTRIKGRFGGEYLTEISVGDAVVARARHRDWRRSYKLLALEVEKLYADGVALA